MVSRTLDRHARFGTADSRLLIHLCATLALLAGVGAAGTFRPAALHAQTPTNNLTRLLALGGDDAEGELAFGTVADVAFGPGELIYVLDAMNGELRIFDMRGAYVRTIGRSGEGPGEVRYPTRVVMAHDGVTLWDATLRRRVQYDHAGRHIDTETHTLPAGFDLALPLRHGQWLLGTMSISIPPAWMALGEQSARFVEVQGPAIRRSTDQVAAIQRPGESVLDTIFRYDHGWILTAFAGGSGGLLPLMWGPGGAWAVSGDSLIALVNTMEAHVRFVRVEQNGTRLVRSARLDTPPRPLHPRDWRELETLHRSRRDTREALYLFGPDFQPQLGVPVFAEDGTLWIPRTDNDPRRPEPQNEARQFILLPSDGTRQSTVQLPAGFHLKAVRGNLLLGVRMTDLGVGVVELWQLR